MNDELFPIPVVPIPALEKARQRFAQAKADYDHADDIADEFGEAVPREIRREYHEAEHLLILAEADEVRRRK